MKTGVIKNNNMKKLNSKLFEKNRISKSVQQSIRGGKEVVDGCYSGEGPDGHGVLYDEYCIAYDDGSWELQYVRCE